MEKALKRDANTARWL